MDFEPAESVGRESVDESVFNATRASYFQMEGTHWKNEAQEHKNKSKKKVYYAVNNESVSSRGGYYERNSDGFGSAGQIFDSNQYSGSDKAVVERIQKSIRDHSDLGSKADGSRAEDQTYELKDDEPELNRQKTKKYVYKDAMRPIDVFAYSIGHFANDLVI